MSSYLALLRGINVGGNNLIKMADLKTCFEGMGFSAVSTFIQSGNVLFRAKTAHPEKLALKIEKALAARFRYPARVAVMSHAELKEAVENAPKGFGSAPAKYRYNVIFIKRPYGAAEAMKSVNPRPGVDTAHQGKHALYFSHLIAKASQSRLSKIVGTPAYASMTIRNWNTTTRLLALMEAAQA
jgi:uncharacterized protein (DUF1697 family)